MRIPAPTWPASSGRAGCPLGAGTTAARIGASTIQARMRYVMAFDTPAPSELNSTSTTTLINGNQTEREPASEPAEAEHEPGPEPGKNGRPQTERDGECAIAPKRPSVRLRAVSRDEKGPNVEQDAGEQSNRDGRQDQSEIFHPLPRSGIKSAPSPCGHKPVEPAHEVRCRGRPPRHDGRHMTVEQTLVIIGQVLGGEDHDRD